MGLLSFIILVLIVLGVLVVFQNTIFPPPQPPVLKDNWWGKGEARKMDEAIRPFNISVPDEVLFDLHDRLEMSNRLIAPMENVAFSYGFNTKFLKNVLDYWRDDYDWEEQEQQLNKYPHFKTNIEGIDIHFMHVKPQLEHRSKLHVLPLLLIHGWPGSIVEFYKIIPLLTTPRKGKDFVFEVICPSIPGYGFSEAAYVPGMGAVEVAQMMQKLLKRLGFEKVYLQGGDWGALITSSMAKMYPESVLGLHLNMFAVDIFNTITKLAIGSVFPTLVMDEKDINKIYPLSNKFAFILQETGYFHLQATKPDTIGVALSHSPIGLAAYILEKFSTWTNPSWINEPDGGLLKKFTLDELLNNVMIYWITGSITTSMRLYSEVFNERSRNYKIERVPCLVPTGLAAFPNELLNQPEAFARTTYHNVVSYTDMPTGGHFAAFEEPQLLADDIWKVVEIIERMNNQNAQKTEF